MTLGSKEVLAGADFSMSEGQRLALIGENGSGKTTLLRILCEKLKPDGGQLFGLENGCAYVAQDFSGNPDETPYEFLSERVADLHVATTLLEDSGFDLGEDHARVYGMSCRELSGGEQKKLEMVAALATGSSFIALDEPENHLDYQTIEWLLGHLATFRGGVIFVSHDQYLIDALADSILELENGVITTFSMRYDEYLAEKERQISGEARQWMMEEQTIKRLRETVQMMRVRAKRNSDTAATYQQTKRRFEELKAQHGTKPTAEPNRPKVSLGSVSQKRGKVIVSIENLTFAYDDHPIFRKTSAELGFGEKVVLFGPNGSGKSTLLGLLTGQLTPHSGTVEIGVNIRWQMITQDHLADVDANRSPLQVLQDVLSWPEHRCRALLVKYGIRMQLATRPLRILSGGQQARFKLALTFAQEPEFLILDEPTNHVDPPTWEAIVDAVKGFSGTVLAVTHDRAFIDAIAEKLWVIEDRKIVEELGTLSDYIGRMG
ncbi:ABC-F family ATP-binding cassette domain-containing protein [Candidatus Berkelbacteria bacterium]|nr:ABC-F family ATP-binding cassette domain-containing protein [Candidatus Berkelbacteria bacterium]